MRLIVAWPNSCLYVQLLSERLTRIPNLPSRKGIFFYRAFPEFVVADVARKNGRPKRCFRVANHGEQNGTDLTPNVVMRYLLYVSTELSRFGVLEGLTHKSQPSQDGSTVTLIRTRIRWNNDEFFLESEGAACFCLRDADPASDGSCFLSLDGHLG